MTMRDHETNPPTDTVEFEAHAQDDLMADGFDPASVFADPVEYLATFGLRSELAETNHGGYAAAA